MTTENYSIEPLPTPKLAKQWCEEWWDQRNESPMGELLFITTKAAQWGFNQRGAVNEAELQKARDEELEACCEWLRHDLDAYELVCLRAVYLDHNLRAARRPKPKSQAEEAIKALDSVASDLARIGEEYSGDIIRAALERLRELENEK